MSTICFFCQHTSHANSKSQESYGFFFHLPCFMLSCHFEPISNATIMGHFFLYNTVRCILTLFLPWNICLRLYDGNHITHYFGEFEGHQNQESPLKRCFFRSFLTTEGLDWFLFRLMVDIDSLSYMVIAMVITMVIAMVILFDGYPQVISIRFNDCNPDNSAFQHRFQDVSSPDGFFVAVPHFQD